MSPVNTIKEVAFALLLMLGMAAFVYAWARAARRAWKRFQDVEWDDGHRPEDCIRDPGAIERARIEREWP